MRFLHVFLAGLLCASCLNVGGGVADPVVPLHGICDVTAECVREADACLRFGPDFVGAQFSLCSHECESDADCTGGAHCFTPTEAGIAKLCVARCSQGCVDCCDEGLTCRVNLGPEPLCRP